ncbi:hypothetical protein BJF79_17820 [Actinomadura sp. CNU-125]|uniref:hypothetical protein n=1 Tax=Actinomadura sp. CNU-125 TaxID=1904961 RepID=UPI000962A1CF|nr:hypothetical protein [Actinomadura sp. CNU-125]OLT17411.1 hypothetical protein BJF79_17820 [Actinomadura sp. CNU-125]
MPARAFAERPVDGALVQVCGRRWVVGSVGETIREHTVVDRQSVEDGHYGETLRGIREIEATARTLPSAGAPSRPRTSAGCRRRSGPASPSRTTGSNRSPAPPTRPA